MRKLTKGDEQTHYRNRQEVHQPFGLIADINAMDAAKALSGSRVFMSRVILDSKGAKFLGGDRAHPARMYVRCLCQTCQQGPGQKQPAMQGDMSPQTAVMSLVDFLLHCYPGAAALGENERCKLVLRHTLIEIDVPNVGVGQAMPIYFDDAMIHLGAQAKSRVPPSAKVWVAKDAINNRAVWECAGHLIGFNDATGCHKIANNGQQVYEVHFALNNVGVEDPSQPEYSRREDGPTAWHAYIARQAPWLPHHGQNYALNRNIQMELGQLLAKAVQELPDQASERHVGIMSKNATSPTTDTAISNVTPAKQDAEHQQHIPTFAHHHQGTQSGSSIPQSHQPGMVMTNVSSQPAYPVAPQQMPGSTQPGVHPPMSHPHIVPSQQPYHPPHSFPPPSQNAFPQQPPGFPVNPAATAGIPTYPQQTMPGQYGVGVHPQQPHGALHGMPSGQPGVFGQGGLHAPQIYTQPVVMQQQPHHGWHGPVLQQTPGAVPQPLSHMQHTSISNYPPGHPATIQPRMPQLHQQQPYATAQMPQQAHAIPSSIPNQPPTSQQQATMHNTAAAAGIKSVSSILAAMLPPETLQVAGDDAQNKGNVKQSLFTEGMMNDILNNLQGLSEDQWHALSLCWQFLPSTARFQLYTQLYKVLSSIPQPNCTITTELPGMHDWIHRIYQQALERAQEDLDMLGLGDIVRKLAGKPPTTTPNTTATVVSD